MPTNDLHARLAATILAQLETADPASWTPPWHGADPMPHNARTGRRYRGINVLALWCAGQAQGYADARWATYRQWAALDHVAFHARVPLDARLDEGDRHDAMPDRFAHEFFLRPVGRQEVAVRNGLDVEAEQVLVGPWPKHAASTYQHQLSCGR